MGTIMVGIRSGFEGNLCLHSKSFLVSDSRPSVAPTTLYNSSRRSSFSLGFSPWTFKFLNCLISTSALCFSSVFQHVSDMLNRTQSRHFSLEVWSQECFSNLQMGGSQWDVRRSRACVELCPQVDMTYTLHNLSHCCVSVCVRFCICKRSRLSAANFGKSVRCAS